ncbi:GAF domain-containing protein [Dactylosporangium sp. McL0621]|uniref:GAF domain-containing protein n=1 Tax=Dactylosporangium sp. McL0621 TaxID=3415678 RepID=UPI003CF31C85
MSKTGGSGRDGAEVPFVADARLELDELLEQLVERIRDVQNTQGRLRGLLRANLDIAQGVDLEQVLRQIVSASRQLVDARYAALGVVQDGHLARFLHEGMDPAIVGRIGGLPEGKGLLGALVDDPQPIRLAEIAEHPASAGFPEDHPPMHSFLGVPIRVRDRVFGHLYLAEKQGAAEFSRDDEEVAKALAGAAGVAIENATLFDEARRRRDWQEAMTAVTTDLLRGADRDQSVRCLADCALQASGADGAAFTAPPGDPASEPRVTLGFGLLEPWHGRSVSPVGTLAESVLDSGVPALVTDPAGDPRTAAEPGAVPQLGSMMAAPVAGNHGLHGVLTIAHRRGSDRFEGADLEQFAAFAVHAGLVLDVAALRRENEQIQALEDRQRIATELQDTLIRDLFALGLSLQGVAARNTNPDTRAGLAAGVDDLDRIIRAVRTAVFAMEPRPDRD